MEYGDQILPLVFLMWKYMYVTIACVVTREDFFVINTMFIFRYFSNDALLLVSTRVAVCINA